MANTPTFLTVNSALEFRNGPFKHWAYRATLNGKPVHAYEADTERGYVDTVPVLSNDVDRKAVYFGLVRHRLFGEVRLFPIKECGE